MEGSNPKATMLRAASAGRPIENGDSTTGKLTPFLKWAGGKRWFVEKRATLLPAKFDRYLEPFLGGGAVFFHMTPRAGILSDKNPELIEAYQTVRDSWEAVFAELLVHDKKHSKTYYYSIRDRKFRSSIRRAARFIYLNRTCWNGLYRVNLRGAFNVPIGTKTKVVLPTDDFAAIASLLRPMTLAVADYKETIAVAKKGDFLFIDPPYVTKRHSGAFIKYNEKLFSWSDQIALRDCLVAAKNRKAMIVATNADNKVIRRLYENDFNIATASRASVISGDAASRGRRSELIIST